MKAIHSTIIFLSIILSGCNHPKSIHGYWYGFFEINEKKIDFSVDFRPNRSTFSSMDLMLIDQTIDDLKIKNEGIEFSLNLDVEMHFKGLITQNKINGTLAIQDSPFEISVSLTKQKQSPYTPYSIEPLTIKSGELTLSAELYKQKTKEKHPAILLLHGSSSNLKDDYRFDADFFAQRGFQVLIFDKRGNGKSDGNYSTSNYNELIGDAIACLEKLKALDYIDTNRIGIWGYSQGAMLLPKIASQTNIPTFLIAKSPEVTSVSEAAAYADSLRIIKLGYSNNNGHTAADSHRKVNEIISIGADYIEVENFINKNARTYPFMYQTGLYGNIRISKNEYDAFYWKGRTENFYHYWETLNIPTLVLWGERDELVNARRNELLLKNTSNAYIEIILFPRANHHLKKTFDPSIDKEFDFPRLIEGYKPHIEKFISTL